MAHIDNMRHSVAYIPYSNDKVLQNSCFHHSTLPLSSTAPSDLAGNLSSTGPYHENLGTLNYCKCGLASDSRQLPFSLPPSPPPTNSDPKRSVPLPSLGLNAEAGPLSPIPSRYIHPRELRITIATKCVPLLSFPVPITPPPTIPTPTLALPPADADMDPELSPIPTSHDDWDISLLGLPLSSGCPDQGKDHLFSPIYPEWTTKGLVFDAAPSLPLSSNTASVLLGGDHSNLFAQPESLPYLQESDDNNTSPHCRPILPFLDIPFSTPKSMWSESTTSSVDFDEELNILATPNTLDTDMDVPSTPRSLFTSPFAHEPTLPPDDKLFEEDFGRRKYLTFFEPPVHGLDFLPELDDIPDSHSSPSLRSFSTLPSLDEDEDSDPNGLISPPSPGATLLPLPGTDPDDLVCQPNLDSYLSPGIQRPSFGSSSSSLLLLEDEAPPRSPSPENCDVEPAFIADSTDPDVCRLGELRRRSLNAERAARQLEQSLLEQGAVHQRWEARRARKKEKERGREIDAMLRLNMAQEKEREKSRAEGVEIEGGREEERVVKKGAVRCMSQLVAKMLLRRNDTYRSLANRKTPLTSGFHKSSPLVRYGDFDNMDVDDGHEQEHENERSNFFPWTGDSDSESEPRTLPAWTTF